MGTSGERQREDLTADRVVISDSEIQVLVVDRDRGHDAEARREPIDLVGRLVDAHAISRKPRGEVDRGVIHRDGTVVQPDRDGRRVAGRLVEARVSVELGTLVACVRGGAPIA